MRQWEYNKGRKGIKEKTWFLTVQGKEEARVKGVRDAQEKGLTTNTAGPSKERSCFTCFTGKEDNELSFRQGEFVKPF